MAKSKNENRLLASLSWEDRAFISAHFTEFEAPAGTTLQETGQPIKQIFFLHSGLISLRNVMQNGDAVEVATIGNESIVGGIVALKGPFALSTAVVQIPITASRITKTRFMNCLAQSPILQNLALRTTEHLMGQMQQISACNASHQIEARLARKLLQSADREAGPTFFRHARISV